MRTRRQTFAAAVISASTLLIGCAQEQPEALIQSAKGYLEKKDNRAAIVQLKSALQKNPDSGEARYLLGRAFLESGDLVAAEVELQKAQALQYPATSVAPAVARVLLQQGKYQKLVDTYASTSLSEPAAVADLETSLASAFERLGKAAPAEARFETALRAVPEYAPALLARARATADRGDLDTGIAIVDRVLARNAKNDEALALKGDLLLYGKRDLEGGLQAYRQVLQVKKDSVAAHTGAMRVLFARKDMAGAQAQLEQMTAALPGHPQTRLAQAQLAYLNKDDKTAKEITQQLLRIAKDNVQLLSLAASIELRSGSPVIAESHLGKAVQLAPAIPELRRMLAQVHLRSAEPARALETLAPLLDSPNPDPVTLALAGQAHLQRGELKEAEPFFVRAAKLDPKDTRSRIALALTEFSKGNRTQAYSELEELATEDKGVLPDLALISANARQGRFDAALKAIDALEQKQPGKPLAHTLRGQVHLARKDLPAARQSLEKALTADPTYIAAAMLLSSLDMADKKPDAAEQRFRRVLKADPNNLRALLAIADLRARSSAPRDEVTKLLTQAVQLHPSAETPRLALVEHLIRSEKIKDALGAAQDGVAAQPQSAALLDVLGRAQSLAGDSDQAIRTYAKLSEVRPGSPVAHVRLAAIYIDRKDYDTARKNLNRALAVSPGLLDVQRSLVSVELAAGRPQAALEVARAVQDQRGHEAAGAALVGDIEASQKNWSGAVAAYRGGIRKSPSGELAVKLHAVLAASSQGTEAERFSARWLKEHPRDVTFIQYLGDQALMKRNYRAAKERYGNVVKLQGDNAVALNNLALVTSRLQEPGALAFAQKANALRPNNPGILDTLSMVLAQEGQLGNAIEIQKKAVSLAPENPWFRLNLAKLYVKSGEKSLAKSELARLSQLGERFAAQSEVTKLLNVL